MGVFNNAKGLVNRFNNKLKVMADNQAKAAEERAKKKMAVAQTKTEKLKIQAEKKREKAEIYSDLAQAQKANKEAAAALQKAKLESGELTLQQRLIKTAESGAKGIKEFRADIEKFQKEVDSFGKPKKKTTKKATKKKTTNKKQTYHYVTRKGKKVRVATPKKKTTKKTTKKSSGQGKVITIRLS
jgi:hypothetical protein